MMNGLGYGFGLWGIFGMLFQLAIMVGVIYLIVSLFQSFSKPNNERQREKTSLQILEERYARGEIEDEEFMQKRKALKE